MLHQYRRGRLESGFTGNVIQHKGLLGLPHPSGAGVANGHFEGPGQVLCVYTLDHIQPHDVAAGIVEAIVQKIEGDDSLERTRQVLKKAGHLATLRGPVRDLSKRPVIICFPSHAFTQSLGRTLMFLTYH